ncbi:hypothetical protein HZA40_02945 [Candidatus Peregrinibacteria bacterium]|nr:hypothetical protein [Candidatus Peregrinibacteria bacterium]
MENTQQNPLNTGNGTPSQAPSVPQTATAPVNITPGIVKPPAAAPVTQSPIEKAMAMKKYIIAGVGVVALLVSAYMAYSYYTGISSAVDTIKTEAQDLNNKLTTPAPTDQNTTVDQLKQQVKNDNPTPPGMTIDLSGTTTDTTKTDKTTSTDTTNKTDTSTPATTDSTAIPR